MTNPICFVIAGPNGAGKTSTALRILPALDCLEYLNADAMAAALSPFSPNNAALPARSSSLINHWAMALARKTGCPSPIRNTLRLLACRIRRAKKVENPPR